MPGRGVLPWVAVGVILAALVLAAVSFRREPGPVVVEARSDPAPRVPAPETPKPPEAPKPLEAPKPSETPRPLEAAPAPSVARPVPDVPWRDGRLEPASADADAPMLLIRVHSLGRVFRAMKTIGEEGGRLREINGVLAAMAASGGGMGLPGIDPAKPWGAYMHFPPGASRPMTVGLVPVSDRTEFLKLLAALHCPADPDDSGAFVVRHRQLPAPVRFRFADGYAYATMVDPVAIDDGRRLAPDRLFRGEIRGDAVVTARADRLPAPIREAILSQVDVAADRTLRQIVGANDSQRAAVRRVAESTSAVIRGLFDGKAELTLRIGVDHAAREFVADLQLRGASDSWLERSLSTLAPGPSRFAAVIAGNPALAALVHFQFPEETRRLLAGAAREATARVARDAGADFGSEQERFFKFLESILEAGEVDAALAVRSHGVGRPGAVFGLKVPDGEALDRLFRDLVARDVTPEDRAPFRFDSDNFPNAKVHRYETAALAREMPAFAPMLGGGPNLIGFSKDAVWLAGGTNGLDTLREALEAPSRPAPIFQFELNVKALSELVPVNVGMPDEVRASLNDEHPGRLRLTLEAGDGLHLRGRLDLALFRLASRLVNVQARLEARPAVP